VILIESLFHQAISDRRPDEKKHVSTKKCRASPPQRFTRREASTQIRGPSVPSRRSRAHIFPRSSVRDPDASRSRKIRTHSRRDCKRSRDHMRTLWFAVASVAGFGEIVRAGTLELERLTHGLRNRNTNPKRKRGKNSRKIPRLRFGLVWAVPATLCNPIVKRSRCSWCR